MSSALEALLGGGPGGPPPGPDAGGMAGPPPGLGGPPGMPPGPPGPGGPGHPGPDTPAEADALQQAVDALKRALDEEQDDVEKQDIVKALQSVQGILAGRAKDAEAAMGVTPQLKFVRRQAQAQG